MAGIGVNLNKIFEKNTIVTNIVGCSYSTMSTISPMLLVIANILLMMEVFDVSSVGYSSRALFSCTVLYIFIFALLAASPFNAVLSRYLSDVIYEERYEDILPCFQIGLLMNIVLGCLMGIPFCLWEYFVGNVDIVYVFTGFCGFISLLLVFYSMLYLSICKDYTKISLFFLVGMAAAFGLAALFIWVFGWNMMYSMLLGLTLGFLLIACLEMALVQSYFRESSRRFRPVLRYFRKYWQLIFANFLYTLGLYVHNFVFWGTRLNMTVADSFVCAEPYDLATCIAMFTNISASVIFISSVEMHFHKCYKEYSEAVIGGRLAGIEMSKKRMFSQLSVELMNIARVQFVISVVIYLLVMIMLPRYGFSGMVMQIYPCLASGYFILFVMYSCIIFLYYFNDLNGSVLTSLTFCVVTFLASLVSARFSPIWYGAGFLLGALAGWCVAYGRLRWVEKHIDTHIFCRGRILERGNGPKPEDLVFDTYDGGQEGKEEM